MHTGRLCPFIGHLDSHSLFKNLAGKAQGKSKPEAYFAYARVWVFRGNAASGRFSTGCHPITRFSVSSRISLASARLESRS